MIRSTRHRTDPPSSDHAARGTAGAANIGARVVVANPNPQYAALTGALVSGSPTIGTYGARTLRTDTGAHVMMTGYLTPSEGRS